jgi:hypothetical protein
MARRSPPLDVKRLVLHESGYHCGNPVCRCILTLDIHHLVPVSEDGVNVAENLLALCPNCHALHHTGEIPPESLRAWKMLLLAMNEAYDRRSIDLLLALSAVGATFVSGDGILECAPLIAAGLVARAQYSLASTPIPAYSVSLTDRGHAVVAAWRRGDQEGAVSAAGST